MSSKLLFSENGLEQFYLNVGSVSPNPHQPINSYWVCLKNTSSLVIDQEEKMS